MNYTPVCFISLHQNGLPSGLWAKLCLVTIIKVTAESVHCLWLEPTASWGLIILTNDTKASERGAADGSGTTFALLLCYWLFFFFFPLQRNWSLLWNMACQSAFSRRTEQEKDCRSWRQAGRNGPLGAKLRFVWQVFVRGCISKAVLFRVGKLCSRWDRDWFVAVENTARVIRWIWQTRLVPFSRITEWKIWSKAIFPKSSVVTITVFAQ